MLIVKTCAQYLLKRKKLIRELIQVGLVSIINNGSDIDQILSFPTPICDVKQGRRQGRKVRMILSA